MVSPAWHVNGSTGQVVRILGMAAPDLRTREGQLARCKVSLLLTGSSITVRRIHPLEGTVLPCELEYMGLPLWMHFSEYSEEAKRLARPIGEADTRQLPEILVADA